MDNILSFADGKQSEIVSQSENSTVYRFGNSTGTMTLTEYTVFEGIKLIYRDVHMLRYEAPPAENSSLIEISHCREGRFEQHIGKQYYYLSNGDLSVSLSYGEGSEIYFPTSNFHGLSIVIDPDTAPECLSELLDGVDVRPAELADKFCSSEDCFIIRSNEQLEHIFSELYTVPEHIKTGYIRVKVLELLMFLSCVSTDASRTEVHGCTQSQVKLAKQVCSYVCTNLSTHITIEELAERFRVSPTHLKNSFRSVYGDSVYAFVRTQKMLTAARLLRDTDRTILDIAGECGYDNGSKFSKAFSSVMGATPSEFRRNRKVPIESLRLERKNDFE